MTKTSRERVKASLNFEISDRVPRDVWPLPAITLFRNDEYTSLIEKYPMDISRPEPSPGWSDDLVKACSSKGTYQGDWGSIWQVGEPGVIGEVKEPFLEEWSKLDKLKLPWHLINELDLSFINKKCYNSNFFMLSEVCARPFERLQFLRGTENLFLDLGYGTSKVRDLLKIIHDFNMKRIELWCKTDVDAIFFMDDWGSNDNLLVSPDIFRDMFKPLYKEYCKTIHSSNKYAFFHTDGNITEIYGDLIEVGVDAINSQLFCMDIENLAKKYKGKITIWGEIDRQHILPFGSKKEVFDAVMRVRKAFGDKGVIAQCEWGKDNPKENIGEVYRAWLE